MKNLIARFVKDESGATAIEYGLIAAGISLAIIAVVNGIGTKLNTQFGSISTSLQQAMLSRLSPKALGVRGLLFSWFFLRWRCVCVRLIPRSSRRRSRRSPSGTK